MGLSQVPSHHQDKVVIHFSDWIVFVGPLGQNGHLHRKYPYLPSGKQT